MTWYRIWFCSVDPIHRAHAFTTIKSILHYQEVSLWVVIDSYYACECTSVWLYLWVYEYKLMNVCIYYSVPPNFVFVFVWFLIYQPTLRNFLFCFVRNAKIQIGHIIFHYGSISISVRMYMYMFVCVYVCNVFHSILICIHIFACVCHVICMYFHTLTHIHVHENVTPYTHTLMHA